MSASLLAIQIMLAVIFSAAGTAKLLDPMDFAAALRITHIPDAGVSLLVAVLPPIELACAVSLVLGNSRSEFLGLLMAVGLLGIFAAWSTWAVARRLNANCGCFGGGHTKIGRKTVFRNLGLLGFAAAGTALTQQTASALPRPSFAYAGIVASGLLGTSLFVGARRAFASLVLTQPRLARHLAATSDGT